MNFYYSKAIQKYVSLSPLSINSRTVQAAERARIKLQWNDAGHICSMTFLEARKLLAELGSSMLSATEYPKLMTELKQTNSEFINKISSDKFAEWLDSVYYKSGESIEVVDHPAIEKSEIVDTCAQPVNIPTGRPGWFDSNDLSNRTYPENVKSNYRDLHSSADIWKYWSPHRQKQWVAGIRGYVVSSDTQSLDLDIPLDAHQPSLLIREVQSDVELIDPGEQFLKNHAKLKSFNEVSKHYTQESDTLIEESPEMMSLLHFQVETLAQMHPNDSKHYREIYIDLVGTLTALGCSLTDSEPELLDSLLVADIPRDRTITLKDILSFVSQSYSALEEALRKRNDIVFVVGHEHPDADAIIAAVLEAYRLQLLESRVVIPIVYGDHLPREVKALIPQEIEDKIVFISSDLYRNALESGLARWVIVDSYYHPKPKFIAGIVDHHEVPQVYMDRQDIYCSSENCWNSILQVVYKFLGMGLKLDQPFAQLALTSTLLEADYRALQDRMNPKDKMLWDQLTDVASLNVDGIQRSYRDLMSEYLVIDSLVALFWRDYKQDLGNFGTAVIKMKEREYESLTHQGSEFEQLANTAFDKQNLAAVVVNVSLYDEDYNFRRGLINVYLGINREPALRHEINSRLKEFLTNYYEQFPLSISETDLGLEYSSVPFQAPRLLIGPIVARVVSEQDKFFFSPSTNLFVSREFTTFNDIKGDGNTSLLMDKTYVEIKQLLRESQYQLLSAPEYFKILNDAKVVNDYEMVRSLTSTRYTEFLDSVLPNSGQIVHHPALSQNSDLELSEGLLEHTTPYAHPGLMKLSDINGITGLPDRVYGPNIYGDEELWRFWAADNYPAIVVRSYIFLLLRPSLDLKISFSEAHSNLGFRLVYANDLH